jgi:hypothetical protein
VMLGFCCLAIALRSGRARWLFLCIGGAALAASVCANLFAALFAPLPVLCYAVINHSRRRYSLTISLLMLTLGGAILISILSILNFILTGNALFLLSSLQFASSLAGSNPYKTPGYAWVLTDPWLAAPAVFASSSAIVLGVSWSRRLRFSNSALVFHGINLLGIAALSIAELLGQPLVYFYFYVSYCLPGMFLAMGALFARPAGRIRRVGRMAIALSLIVVAVCGLSADGFLATIPYTIQLTASVALSVGALTLAVVRRSSSRIMFVSGWIAMLALVALGLRLGERAVLQQNRDVFDAVIDVDDFVRGIDRDMSAMLWFNHDEPRGGLFAALSWFYGGHKVNDRFPDATESDVRMASRVAILSEDSNALEQARRTLAPLFLVPVQLGQAQIERGNLDFYVVVADLVPAPIADGALTGGVQTSPVFNPQGLDGWQRGLAPSGLCVSPWLACDSTITPDGTGFDLVTNKSVRDWQLSSEPISVLPGRQYTVRFYDRLVSGGLGMHVVCPLPNGVDVLTSAYWSDRLGQPLERQLLVDTGTCASVQVVIGNGTFPSATRSHFSIWDLAVWLVQ